MNYTPGCLSLFGANTLLFHINMSHDPPEIAAHIWVFYFQDVWMGDVSNVYCGLHTVCLGHVEIIE